MGILNVEKQNQIAIILGIGLILSCLFLCHYSEGAIFSESVVCGNNILHLTPNAILFPNVTRANQFISCSVTDCINYSVNNGGSGTVIAKDYYTGVVVWDGSYSYTSSSFQVTAFNHYANATHSQISLTFSPTVTVTYNSIARSSGTTIATISGYALTGTHVTIFDDSGQIPVTTTSVASNCNWTTFTTYLNPSSEIKYISSYVYNSTNNIQISHSIGSTYSQYYIEYVFIPIPGNYTYSFSYNMNGLNYPSSTNFFVNGSCVNSSNITGPINPYVTPTKTGPWSNNTTWNNLTFPVISNWTNYNVTPIGFFPPYLTNWTIMNRTDIMNYFNNTLIPIDLVNGYFNLIDNLINAVKNAIQQALSVLLSPIFWLIDILSQIQSWETMILAQLIYYISPLKLIFNVVFYILPQPIYYLILFVLVYYLIKIILKGRK